MAGVWFESRRLNLLGWVQKRDLYGTYLGKGARCQPGGDHGLESKKQMGPAVKERGKKSTLILDSLMLCWFSFTLLIWICILCIFKNLFLFWFSKVWHLLHLLAFQMYFPIFSCCHPSKRPFLGNSRSKGCIVPVQQEALEMSLDMVILKRWTWNLSKLDFFVTGENRRKITVLPC